MSTSNTQHGFSLIELLIVIAIIGIVAAVGIPAYRGYIDTANMSKVNAAYESAVRLTRQEYAKDTTRVSLGLMTSLPTTDDGWISLMDPSGAAPAPGGGRIYMSGSDGKVSKAAAAAVGAVTVKYDSKKARVEIRRPEYLSLSSLRARIDKSSIDIKEE